MKNLKFSCKECGKITKIPNIEVLVKFYDGFCCIRCNTNHSMKQLKLDRIKRYKELSLEKKQTFLDLLHKGKTIGEAKETIGIDIDLACEIINQNIIKIEYLSNEVKEE